MGKKVTFGGETEIKDLPESCDLKMKYKRVLKSGRQLVAQEDPIDLKVLDWHLSDVCALIYAKRSKVTLSEQTEGKVIVEFDELREKYDKVLEVSRLLDTRRSNRKRSTQEVFK